MWEECECVRIGATKEDQKRLLVFPWTHGSERWGQGAIKSKYFWYLSLWNGAMMLKRIVTLVCPPVRLPLLLWIFQSDENNSTSSHQILRQNNAIINTLFFLLPAATHHSFIFDSQYFYNLKRNIRVSKSVWGIFHFWFLFNFLKIYIFVHQTNGIFDIKMP